MQAPAEIAFKTTPAGCVLEFPLKAGSEVYGFGLQLKGFAQRSRKKITRPNADPPSNTGDSHAPVPFFVTTEGWGVFIDTARYAQFYCGFTKKGFTQSTKKAQLHTEFSKLYADRQVNYTSVITALIPAVQGVDIYIFKGENITDVVSEYNMFAGGGCEVPMWGLGNLYRCHAQFNSAQVLEMAHDIRSLGIPCDMLGLEPGWQSCAYSSSFVWDSTRFSDWQAMLEKLRDDGFRVNLWEHAFVHPTSPLYEKLLDHSGDYTVWNGLVPDFAMQQTRDIFAAHHKDFEKHGVAGYKLDECDGSDYTGNWTFPECAAFPSGLDGEQYHSLFGILYGKAMLGALTKRTLGEVRNSGSLAAPYPYVLYSDLYDHNDFIRGVATSSLSGLLWSPEVRHAQNRNDMIRRVQTVVFSVQSLINAFYLDKMPWIDLDCTEEVKKYLRLRMSFVPYLYEAFEQYRTTGKAPVRALVSDYTTDAQTYQIWNEYLFGDSIIVAPMTMDEKKRSVYLPDGEWYGFFDRKKYSGSFEIETDEIPVFVKAGSIIPLAEPVDHIASDTVFNMTLMCYGNTQDAKARLVEDDFEAPGAPRRIIELTDKTSNVDSYRYTIAGTERII